MAARKEGRRPVGAMVRGVEEELGGVGVSVVVGDTWIW